MLQKQLTYLYGEVAQLVEHRTEDPTAGVRFPPSPQKAKKVPIQNGYYGYRLLSAF